MQQDRRKRERRGVLPTSQEDLALTKRVPKTPQTEASAYKLAFADDEFLTHEVLRPVRLQLELQKTEMMLAEKNIRSTVVLFGGARIPAPGVEAKADTEIARQNLMANAKYYDEARQLAQLSSLEAKKHNFEEYIVVSGGGPGVMEAANLGAHEVDAPSIGLNIVLPHEQAPNEYITPELCFQFHYFAIRKMHFLMRAKAVTAFPGGFGTLDELFETLTLIQTGKASPMPVILFGRAFWENIIDFQALSDAGTISSTDLDLFQFAETGEEGWQIIADWYGL